MDPGAVPGGRPLSENLTMREAVQPPSIPTGTGWAAMIPRSLKFGISLSQADATTSESRRVIGTFGGFAVVAGSMLGIGIFLSPPIVAANTGSAYLFYGMWILGGVIALAGAVACAELGTMMPRAGGDYVFQYEAFGPSVAFASGWVLFVAIFSGSIATMSVGLCQYQLPALLGMDLSVEILTLPWGYTLTGSGLAALLLVPALTLLNDLGASTSTRTQAVLTVVPIVALAFMSCYAIALDTHGPEALSQLPSDASPSWSLHGLVVSYMAVYFAYSGWINIIYVSGEVEAPQRNIPRSLLWGTAAITVLYLFLCTGFVRTLGLAGLSEAGEAGTATAALLGGPAGKTLITLLIASALLASINATILGGARVGYAMARKGAIWRGLGTLGTRHHAPNRALWLQMTLSMALILSGRFEDLFLMVSLAMTVTGTLTVASVFALRRSAPDWPRPYRATGYPWIPAIYVVSSLFTLGVMAMRGLSGEPDAWYPLIGLFVLIAAYLIHRLWIRPREQQEAECPNPKE